MTILRLTKSIGRSRLRLAFLLIPVVLACSALCQQVRAQETPDPGSVGGSLNTADGTSALGSVTTGAGNSAFGWFSLRSDTEGSFNTAVGAGALLFNTADQNTAVGAAALLSNTTGTLNTAFGDTALLSNTTGDRNTALGSRALNANTTGHFNTGVGRSALLFNTTGNDNVAVGVDTLQDNTAGANNVAVGDFALLVNSTGNNNTATGFSALGGSALINGSGTGNDNTADGAYALGSNTTGFNNTAIGANALFNNTDAEENTATGVFALGNNTTGNWNTATGAFSLTSNVTGYENTAYGQVALQNVTGSKNVGIGAGGGCKLTTGSNNIAIVNPGVAGESDTIRIGAVGTETNCANFTLPAHTTTFIAGISGTAVVGDTVVVNANGQLGTVASSARFKKEIKPMNNASEAILALKPVTFRYKTDSRETPQFGLIAEEVAKVNPDLVVRDRKGEIYSVHYEAVNAMLLNEFLKEHKKVEKQEATITRLTNDFQTVSTQQRNEIQLLSAQLKEQAAQIQKVSAQLELNKPAPQTVKNND